MKKIKITAVAITILIVAIIYSCKKPELKSNENYSSEPDLTNANYDYDESFNDKLATLGRVLFYDRKLSLNNSVSCGSCHRQDAAFSDGKQFSVGLENVKSTRNTPAIFPKEGRMFWDGRADSLAQLVLMPIANHAEMKMYSMTELIDKLNKTEYYPALFQNAFGSSGISETKIKQALKEFVLNFNFVKNTFSAVTQNFNGTVPAGLSASEKIGYQIFFGKGQCRNCHQIQPNGYGGTDHSHNIGLDVSYTDNGIGALSNDNFRNGEFMVPVLLNVELTAPYMHDGRFKTLEEVVEHYNSGIKSNKNLDWMLRDFSAFNNLTDQEIMQMFDTNHNGQLDDDELPNGSPIRLNLTQAEKTGLVAFLKTLTDRNVLTDVRFSDPFKK